MALIYAACRGTLSDLRSISASYWRAPRWLRSDHLAYRFHGSPSPPGFGRALTATAGRRWLGSESTLEQPTDRLKIAVWNSVMDENDYLTKRWTEFLELLKLSGAMVLAGALARKSGRRAGTAPEWPLCQRLARLPGAASRSAMAPLPGRPPPRCVAGLPRRKPASDRALEADRNARVSYIAAIPTLSGLHHRYTRT